MSPVYNMHVGCTAAGLSPTDSGSFDTTMTRRYVSYSPPYREYRLYDPNYYDPGYCSITSRELVDTAGNADSRVVDDPSSIWYWKYSGTDVEVSFTLKMKHTFTGGYAYLSVKNIAAEIYCLDSQYTLIKTSDTDQY